MLQENSRTEFKSELNDKLEKEVVAFLNNKEGGILYIGLDDIGSPIGVPELDSTQLKIADRIKNNILPSTMGLFDIVTEIIQPNIEKEQQTPKIQYFRGFLYILKIYQTPSKHTKMFR